MTALARARRPQSLRAIFAGIIDPRLTEYRGVVMRSRLETEFARYLDDERIPWRYEPAVFGRRGHRYLPDFELVHEERHHYVEVKPTLAEVPAAERKMLVIRDTHPDAVLVVACAEDCRWFATIDGFTWIDWVQRWAHG